MIKAVIFDVDGVLLDSFDANLKFFQDLMLKTGYPSPTREEFPPIFHLNMKDAIRKLTKSESEEEIQRIWEIGKSREVPYDIKLLKHPNSLEIVINKLHDNYKLGIVTSRVRESVWEAPGLKKLKNYFKIAVGYQDTEKHKPEPEPLLLASERIGVQPEDCVYIGDVINDVTAARAAGMNVIIYSKNVIDSADRHTTDFKELPRLISEL